jgi:FecR protein
VSARSVGRLQIVAGLVAITRASGVAGQPVAGDVVYPGDVIETGMQGSVTIAFVDGTQLRLHPGARIELYDFFFRPEKQSASTLARIVKGQFEFIGGKSAVGDGLTIDTPVGELRSRSPGLGFGAVALGVFSFAFLPEVKADSADIALLDNGLIDYKDLKHGVFEIITKGEHPQRIIVDDPTQTVILRARIERHH